MKTDKEHLAVYQIAYDNSTCNAVFDEIETFNISSKNIPKFREINAIKLFTASKPWEKHKYTGIFSPRFSEKTQITYSQIAEFISEEQDADIFLFHPYPLEFSIANGFLDLAELEHPGITQALEDVWCKIFNDSLPYVSCRDDVSLICHCNYFIASESFWENYSNFVDQYWDYLIAGNNTLQNKTDYTLSKSKDIDLPLGVFAFERALTLFLKYHEEKFTVGNFSDWNKRHKFPELFKGELELISGIKNVLDLYPIEQQIEARFHSVQFYYEMRKCIFSTRKN